MLLSMIPPIIVKITLLLYALGLSMMKALGTYKKNMVTLS